MRGTRIAAFYDGFFAGNARTRFYDAFVFMIGFGSFYLFGTCNGLAVKYLIDKILFAEPLGLGNLEPLGYIEQLGNEHVVQL